MTLRHERFETISKRTNKRFVSFLKRLTKKDGLHGFVSVDKAAKCC